MALIADARDRAVALILIEMTSGAADLLEPSDDDSKFFRATKKGVRLAAALFLKRLPRAKADQMHDADARTTMLGIAHSHDLMAMRAAARDRPSDGGNRA